MTKRGELFQKPKKNYCEGPTANFEAPSKYFVDMSLHHLLMKLLKVVNANCNKINRMFVNFRIVSKLAGFENLNNGSLPELCTVDDEKVIDCQFQKMNIGNTFCARQILSAYGKYKEIHIPHLLIKFRQNWFSHFRVNGVSQIDRPTFP